MADEDTLRGLATKLTDRRPEIHKLDAYYDGEKRLAALGISLPPEMRALQTIVNWPRLVVDALMERIVLTGFRMRGSQVADDRLWGWWQRNNMDEEFPLGILEMFVQGRGYVSVSYDEDRPDTPIYRCESARSMSLDIDPRTRRINAAARLYDQDPSGEARSATLYLPGVNRYYAFDQGRWRLTESIETGIDRVPIVPMVNRARLYDRSGRSEMADVMGITDAACRNLTNLQGAQELMALPSRYVHGITDADMKDKDGNPVPKWQAYLGRFNTLADPNSKVTQLSAADLRNFYDGTSHYARIVSSLTGLPTHYLGLVSDNPASADAIRSAEARHVKRAEDKGRVVGGVAEDVSRLGMEIVDGEVPEEAERMEAILADPATPTYASKVDSVVKLYGNGTGLLPREAAWEELGYGPEKIARYKSMLDRDPTSRLIQSLGIGQDPQNVEGVDQALPNSPTDEQ